MKNIFLFLYPLVSWGGMCHVVPFLVEFFFVLEVSLVRKCRYEKVCSSRLIHTSLHWCLIGF